MTISGGAGVDRPVEIEMLTDAARRQIHDARQHRLDPPLLDSLAGSVMQVDIDRQRLGNADGIGELDGAAPGKAGGDDILGKIAGSIGGRAVDLGRVLAGEGATAMRGSAAVSVDNDLAPGQPAIAIRTANIEFTGGIDVPHGVRGDPVAWQCGTNIRINDLEDVLRCEILMKMLVRHDNLGHVGRLAVAILHRHLAFGIGAELDRLAPAGTAGLAQGLEDLMGIVDRSRHELRRLVAGIAEHDSLVAGADILVAQCVNALGNVRRLAVQQHLDRRALPMEAALLVADVLDRLAGALDDAVTADAFGSAILAGNDNPVGGGEGLAGDPYGARIGTGGERLAVEQRSEEHTSEL